MTGPPTPPPTSEIEIKDAARSSVPPQGAPLNPQQSPSAQPKNILGAYQLIFPTLADLASQGSYKDLVRVAERGDLNAEGDAHPSRLLLTSVLVLSYLILDEVPSAQFALLRLPSSLQSHPLPQSLFRLLASASERKYEKVYNRAEEVYNALKKPVDPNYDLASVAGPLVKTFVDTFRRKTLVLLSKAYTSIPVSLSRAYLGLTPEQTLEIAKENKWTFNATSQVFYPVPIQGDLSAKLGSRGQSSLATLHTVTASNFEDK